MATPKAPAPSTTAPALGEALLKFWTYFFLSRELANWLLQVSMPSSQALAPPLAEARLDVDCSRVYIFRQKIEPIEVLATPNPLGEALDLWTSF